MTLHAFQGGGSRCTHPDPAGPFGRCGNGAGNTNLHYLSRADLWRAATAGQPLPETFTISMRYWLIVDATMVEIPGVDNVRTDVFTTALRAAISTAEEWRDVAKASRELNQEVDRTGLGRLIAGENYQAIYCANTLLRAIARELYAEHVPEEERYG